MDECAIPVATDVACAKAFDENAEAEIKKVEDVQDDDMIFDLGPDSTAQLAEILKTQKLFFGMVLLAYLNSKTSKRVLKVSLKRLLLLKVSLLQVVVTLWLLSINSVSKLTYLTSLLAAVLSLNSLKAKTSSC